MVWLFSGMCRSTARLDGKTAIITGANTGMGKETALDFATRGARVVMLVRDIAKGEAAAADIRQRLAKKDKDGHAGHAGHADLVVQRLDLASLQSVRECARLLLQQEKAIHILVNNAGIMACPKASTVDGNDLQFGVNHLGHFLLSVLLLPRMRATARAQDNAADPVRIVTVSSLAYSFSRIDFDDLHFDKNYKPLMAYARSKLGNMLFTRELARRCKEEGVQGVHTYCLHPGAVDTDLFRHFDSWIFPGTQFLLEYVGRFFIKTAKQGAQTTIHCAVSEKAAKETGLYYKDCSPTTPLPIGRDDAAALRLWDVSLERVGLAGYDPLTAAEPPASAFQLPAAAAAAAAAATPSPPTTAQPSTAPVSVYL